jgi:signal transduction histidine kinase
VNDTLLESAVLVVDDERANVDLLEAILAGEGYRAVTGTADAREALPLFEARRPDLVLLDLHMPHHDGFEILERISARTDEGDYLPVLVLTADVTPEARERALSRGARDFLTKPFDVGEVLLRVRNLLQTRLLHRRQREARERAEALAAENARLFAGARQATLARDRMLSVVAHDLRNPLALVAMNAEMLAELLDPDADPYQRETVRIVRSAAERMQRLIEDLLDVSRIEHGTFSLERSETPVAELLAEAERLLRPLARARGVALAVAAAPPGGRVRADAGRLIQVLSNLGGNALKFTPAGGRVEVAAVAEGDALKVSVADTGPGIPPEVLPHVFGAFWQAEERDRRGVGLGLWIARSIVEAHGGRIWVDAREGEGSTFHFTVPGLLVPAEPPGAARLRMPELRIAPGAPAA